MKKLLYQYKHLFKDKKYKKAFFVGFILLVFAGLINLVLISYIENVQGTYVSDLILDSIPTFSLFWARTIGMAFIVMLALLLAIYNPKYWPVTLKSFGLMYIIRPIFASLTHLKFHPEKIPIPNDYFFMGNLLSAGNDLFFSGHVAFPFMVSLIFWDNKKVRYSFILLSFSSGLVSLFAKTHYSIDIFAAPFIAYGIFKMAERLFQKDLNYIKNIKIEPK